MTRAHRITVGIALGLGAIAVAAVLLGAGGSYELSARFQSAGRLVEGGDVRVAGRVVGHIKRLDLAPNGLAQITFSVDDDDAKPLPRGTQAQIRAVGAATLTNNFIDLTPGAAGGGSLPSGAVLPETATRGIVDVDAVFASLDPGTRADIRQLTKRSADVFAGSGATWFNDMLARLAPALGELRGLADNLASDRAQLDRFVVTAAQAADAIASRRPDLVAAVDDTATTMTAVQRERVALIGTLERAPATLSQATRTLAGATTTLRALRPTLRRVPNATAGLSAFLRRFAGMLPPAARTLSQLNDQLPPLRRGLARIPAMSRAGVRALPPTAKGFKDLKEIARGLRLYAPDALLGLFNGLLSIGAGNYNKYGHYIHASFVQSPQNTAGGNFSGLLSKQPLIPGVFALKTNVTRLCPGAAAAPAPDNSNRQVNDPSLCDPSQSMSASVNEP